MACVTETISVVVPTYNRAELIGETVERILGQTNPPTELIIVDDGSTDDTESLLQPYTRQIKYIKQTNSGAPVARNRGVAASTGKYVAFCDSDDLWEPFHLEKSIQLFQRFPDVSFAFSNFREFSSDGEGLLTKFDQAPNLYWDIVSRRDDDYWVSSGPIYQNLLKYQPIFPSTIVIRRHFFETISGYDPEMSYLPSEDLEFTLRCVLHGPIGMLATPTVRIRKHGSNDSRCVARQLAGEICVLAYAFQNHDLDREIRRLVYDEVLARVGPAIDAAFGSGLLDLVSSLAPLASFTPLTGRQKIKTAIARLPMPLSKLGNRLLLGGRLVPSDPVVSALLLDRLNSLAGFFPRGPVAGAQRRA